MKQSKVEAPKVGDHSHWHFVDEKNPSKTAIVFVHGVWSKNQSCWTDKPSGKFWPSMAREDPQLSSPDIFLGGYESKLTSKGFDTDDAAKGILQSMRNADVLDRERIVFVCHSQGGIVSRRILLKAQDALRGRKVGLFLCASPSWGSRLASILWPIAWILEFGQARRLAYGDPSVVQLDKDFLDFMQPLGTNVDTWRPLGTCLVETRRMLAVLMPAPADTAGRYFGWQRIPGATHSSIVKPDSLNHPSHQALVDFCRHSEFCTGHLAKTALGAAKACAREVINKCSPNAKTSVDECYTALRLLKEAAKEAAIKLDRKNDENAAMLQRIIKADELHPEQQPGKKEWPLRDILASDLEEWASSSS